MSYVNKVLLVYEGRYIILISGRAVTITATNLKKCAFQPTCLYLQIMFLVSMKVSAWIISSNNKFVEMLGKLPFLLKEFNARDNVK